MAHEATAILDLPSRPATITLGKYENLTLIGEGGMSRVYKGYDPTLDRPVAIKVITPDSREEPGTVTRRFQREARIAAGLNHPNVVTIYEFGKDQGVFFLVMEYLEGADLAQILRSRSLRALEDKLALMEQICAGVAAAHAHGLIHQDLKPGNVFRLPDGRVKILDFGLARFSAAPLTSNHLSGTPQYMSPEQIGGDPPDARSDVFALGALFYEILSGRRCFPAETFEAVFFQVLQRQPDSVRSHDPSLPEIADNILQKALTKDPEARFADASELAEAITWLRRVVAGEGSQSEAASALNLPSPPPSLPIGTSAVAGDPEPSREKIDKPDADRARVTFASEDGGDRELVAGCRPAKTLLELSKGAGIPHYHECGGRGRCSTCRVRVLSGDGLGPRTRVEEGLAGRLGWGPEIRLACQAAVVGDVEVQRLIHDTRDFGLLRFENRHEPPRETALAVLAVQIRNLPELLQRSVPYDTVHVLNRFFLEAGEPVLAAGERLDESRSDGFSALFGIDGGTAADKCRTAARAALRIRARLGELARYTRAYYDVELRTSLGLDFGRTVLGHLGHPTQMHPTAIGDFGAGARQLAAKDAAPATRVLASEDLINVLEGELHFNEVLTGPSAASNYEILDFVKADAVVMVQESFATIAERPHQAAEIFYRLLFEIEPGVQPLFAGTDMALQGKKLMEMLGQAVRGLDRLEEIRPAVEELGRRHVDYGVELRHYDAVEQALLETFRQVLGKRWSVDLRLAWSAVYNQLAGIMIEAGELAR